MTLISNEKIDVIEYEFEILDYIKNHPGGVSLTDIANEKKYSRNTVSKYISILALKNLVYSKKVGTSKLFFSSKENYLPSSTVLTYYKSFLKYLKKYFSYNEQRFKEIGREAAKEIKFAFGPKVFKQLKALKGNPISKIHLEVFKNYYSSYDIFQPNIEISIIDIDPEGKIAIFRFKNSIFLEDSDDYIYHIYLASGITEGILTRALMSPVIVDIKKIHIDNNKEDSYFDLSIKLK